MKINMQKTHVKNWLGLCVKTKQIMPSQWIINLSAN